MHGSAQFLDAGMFDGSDDGFCDFNPSEPLEVCGDDSPRGVSGIGLQNHFLCGFVVFAPLAAVPPIFVRDFPMFVGVSLTPFEAGQLLIFGNVQVDFCEDCAIVDELLFEVVNFLVSPSPFALFRESFHSFDEDASVPGPIEDCDVSVGW